MSKKEIYTCDYCCTTSGNREIVFPIFLYSGSQPNGAGDSDPTYFNMDICGECLSTILKRWSDRNYTSVISLIDKLKKN